MLFRAVCTRLTTAFALSLACLAVIELSRISAEDAKPTSKAKTSAVKPASEAAEEKLDDRPLAVQWDEAFARRKELIEKLMALQEEFPKADNDRKEEIRKEFLDTRDELILDVVSKIDQLAAKVFAADPKNLDAGEAAVRVAFQRNEYAEAIKLAEQVLAVDPKRFIVINIQGVSKFALQDFEAAHEILSRLKEDGELHPELGGRFLDASEEYIEFWKTEQAIREKEAAAKGDKQLPRVLFKTSRGDILLELFENEAPNTVANFISLVEAKKYDGIKFHRVIPNFMAQGGDPNTLDDDPQNDGQGGPGYTIACECFQENARKHFRGSLSMAHTAMKDTGGSQFFLTHLPTAHLNPNEEQQTGHTVFGRVVEGMDVVDALEIGDTIESATVVRKRKHKYEPKTVPDERTK